MSLSAFLEPQITEFIVWHSIRGETQCAFLMVSHIKMERLFWSLSYSVLFYKNRRLLVLGVGKGLPAPSLFW